MIYTLFKYAIEAVPLMILGVIWWHDREAWMLAPAGILIALLVNG